MFKSEGVSFSFSLIDHIPFSPFVLIVGPRNDIYIVNTCLNVIVAHVFLVSMHILLCYIPLSYMCPIEKNGYSPLSSWILQSILTGVDNLYNSQTIEIPLSYWQKIDATLTK